MNIDEFFEWLANYCRENSLCIYANSVLYEADKKGVDVGSIIWVGRKHLIPRGWVRHVATSGAVIYEPPKKKDGMAKK